MTLRIIVPFIASLALCASAAMAQDAPTPPPAPSAPMAKSMGHGSWHMNKEAMQKHRAHFCSDLTPRAAGKLAYLEAKLALTDRQKPLFERWKKAKLANAKARTDECAALKMPVWDASIVDRMKAQEKMLKSRLASLQAEMPSLEALAASLSDEQKHVLDRARGMFGQRMHGMRGMMDRMHHDFDRDDDDAPPAN